MAARIEADFETRSLLQIPKYDSRLSEGNLRETLWVSLPRFFTPISEPAQEGALLALDPNTARHLNVLRLKPGMALELLLPSGVWRAELAQLHKDKAMARLVAPLEENREASIPIEAWIPITAQLSLVDEILPPLVEMGAALIQPVIYARSEFDAKKTAARFERWQKIVISACEQCHRGVIPELRNPAPFEALLCVSTAQKWVAYELATGRQNPELQMQPLAFTSGPEGGITDGEFEALRSAGWTSISLGKAILRAVTAPVAVMGAVQHQIGKQP